MKFFSILAATVISGALAAPASDAVPRADVQTAHFVFQGAESGSYNMSVKADGKVIETCNELPIKGIEANDYNAGTQCVFKDADGNEIESTVDINSDTGTQTLVLDEPTAVFSVSCEGFCVPNYTNCYRNGQYVGSCCNGLCAANFCRPWNGV